MLTCNDYISTNLEDVINRFNNLALFNQAMTHRSCQGQASNECLEYLGDAVLNLAVTDWFLRLHGLEHGLALPEGELVAEVNGYVSGARLTPVARRLKLGCYLHLGRSEEMSGGRDKPKILEDALEALIGAIFLDQGMDAAAAFIQTHITR